MYLTFEGCWEGGDAERLCGGDGGGRKRKCSSYLHGRQNVSDVGGLLGGGDAERLRGSLLRVLLLLHPRVGLQHQVGHQLRRLCRNRC